GVDPRVDHRDPHRREHGWRIRPEVERVDLAQVPLLRRERICWCEAGGRNREGERDRDEEESRAFDHEPTTTRRVEPLTAPAARRYSVVEVGVTATVNEESAPIVRAGPSCQTPPGARCSSVTPLTSSTRPLSVTDDPAGARPAGRESMRTPTRIHPERRPSSR